jgi:ATP-binding cassette, subfamily B, bacterial
VAFLGYIGGLFGPIQGLAGTYQALRRCAVAVGAIFKILDTPDPLADDPAAVPAPRLRGDVRFERVTFAYPGGKTALRELDLHVRTGETVAIIGPSGAGKTTLMSLLQRFDDPASGRVLLDGIDLRRLRARTVREQIGTVLQESFLFDDTIRSNITYGRPTATVAEIRAAARLANADGFIEALADGYDSRVGERGVRLSQGQRQRIAIARVILKDPAILILDEATAALDTETEADVQEALRRTMRDRTTFVIAHRLNTILHADRIVVLHDGCIIECGSHGDLMRAQGYYASLINRAFNSPRVEAAPIPPHYTERVAI